MSENGGAGGLMRGGGGGSGEGATKAAQVGQVAQQAAGAVSDPRAGAVLGGAGAALQGGDAKAIALGAVQGAIPSGGAGGAAGGAAEAAKGAGGLAGGAGAATAAPSLASAATPPVGANPAMPPGGAGGLGAATPALAGAGGEAAGLADKAGGPPVKPGAGAGAAESAPKGALAAAAVPAAGAAGQVLLLVMLLEWLKSMFLTAQAMTQSFLQALWGMLINGAKAAVSWFVGGILNVGSSVAGFVTGSAVSAGTAASTGVAVVTLAGVTMGGIIAPSVMTQNRDDGPLAMCDQMVMAARASAEGAETIDGNAQMNANAQKAHGVLANWGMGDAEIAGILGNWQMESGIDPTGVETIYTEPYVMGERKLAAQAAGFDVSVIAPDYSAEYPKIGTTGVGLGQWTDLRSGGVIEPGRAAGLHAYASAVNLPWYTIEVQLGYMIGQDSPARRDQIDQMIQGTYEGANGTPEAAADFFMRKWEGIDGNIAERQAAASVWYAQMGGWDESSYASLAGSILTQSNATLGEANAATVTTALGNCRDAQSASAGQGMGDWYHPVPGFHTYQGNYGQDRGSYVHSGEDLSAAMDTPIYAISAGTVVSSTCEPFKGRSPCNVLIDHGLDSQGQTVESLYIHPYPGKVFVQTGDMVSAGQEIALVGSNGNSTGPHLHFEIWVNGTHVDPTAFMAGQGVDLRMKNAPPSLGTGGGGGTGGLAGPTAPGAAGAVEFMRARIGDGYRLGANGPSIWDCSSLTQAAWKAVGVDISRTSRSQWTNANVETVEDPTLAGIQVGDLVYWSDTGDPANIRHVALYAGDNKIVHAANPSTGVAERTLNLATYDSAVIGYGRVLAPTTTP